MGFVKGDPEPSLYQDLAGFGRGSLATLEPQKGFAHPPVDGIDLEVPGTFATQAPLFAPWILDEKGRVANRAALFVHGAERCSSNVAAGDDDRAVAGEGGKREKQRPGGVVDGQRRISAGECGEQRIGVGTATAPGPRRQIEFE